jgi:hypothetical protein
MCKNIANIFTFWVNLLIGAKSQLCVFYFHELTPPLMAICQLSVETYAKLPDFLVGFFLPVGFVFEWFGSGA